MRRFGANKALATLYRNGAPPTVGAFAALMLEDAKHEQWEEYVADMLCLNARLKARNAKAIPLYSDMIGKHKQRDSRTGQEIIDSIAARFTKLAREATK